MLEKIKSQMKIVSGTDSTPANYPQRETQYKFISLNNQAKTSHFFGSDKSLEVEIGFGKFVKKGFVPGVTQGEFESLLNLSGQRYKKRGEWDDRVEIDTSSGIRKIVSSDGTVVWQKKERGKDKVEDRHWGYRISSSKEIVVDDPKKFSPSIIRRRKRFSFSMSKFILDLTQISNDSNITTSRDVLEQNIIYEVEIERKDKGADLKDIDEAIAFVLYGLSGGSTPLSLPERSYVASLHNSLFSNDRDVRFNREDSFHLVEGYWNKPKNIKRDDILMSDISKFSSTVKYDGKRVFILVEKTSVYECAPPYDLKLLSRDMSPKKGVTLLDAEKVGDRYYVFDILFLEGKDARGWKFLDRLRTFNSVTSSLGIKNIESKKFYTEGDFYTVAKKALRSMKKSDIPVDGIIFQPSHYYKNKHTKKWKPFELLTIDFKLVAEKDRRSPGQVRYGLTVARYRGDKREDVPFVGSKKNSIPPQYISEVTGIEGLNLNGLVVECRYNKDSSSFEIVRTREDKAGVPNEERVAGDVWDDIIDPIMEITIKGEDLSIMRRLHNLLKAKMLEDTFKKGMSIMDWGSGRGGDLTKWERIGLKKVFVVEPNAENFAILKGRLDEMKLKTDIVPVTKKSRLVGGEDTSTLLKVVGDEELDGIVSFFSLTFFGKDMDTFKKGISSLKKLLPVGGSFIGIVMDGERVKRLVDEEVDTKAFTIRPVSKFSNTPKEGYNEISIKIHDPSSMVDYNEWLFYFDFFVKEMDRAGFRLEKEGYLDSKNMESIRITGGTSRKFSELYNNLAKDAKEFSSSNRYFKFVKVSSKSSQDARISKRSSRDIEISSSRGDTPRNLPEDGDFFKALLYSMDDSETTQEKMEKKALKFRKKVSKRVKFEDFKTMAGGCVRKTMVKIVKEAIEDEEIDEDVTKEDIEQYAYITFQQSIIDDKIDYRMIKDFVSDLMKVDIFIEDTSKREKRRTPGRYTKSVYLRKDGDKIFSTK